MTAIEKVLLRKDAASLVVAIVLGTSVSYFLGGLVAPLSAYITFSNEFRPGGPPIKEMILQSVISFVISIVILELLVRLVTLTRGRLYKKAK